MKKRLICGMLVLLVGCSKEPSIATLADPTPDQLMAAEEEGLSIELAEDQFKLSPATVEAIVRNESGEPFQIGPFFHIEVLKNDEWYMITYSDAVFLENPSFRDGGYVLQDGEEVRQVFSVESLDVTLPGGAYRLVKTFTRFGEQYHEVTVAAPFYVQK